MANVNFNIEIKIDDNGLEQKLLFRAKLAAKQFVQDVGELMAQNFEQVAGQYWTHVPSANVGQVQSDGSKTWVVVTWGEPGSIAAQLSSGDYEPVAPVKDSGEPVSKTFANSRGAARFFPSRATNGVWSKRAIATEPKARNFDLGNVNYTLQNQMSEIERLFNQAIADKFN